MRSKMTILIAGTLLGGTIANAEEWHPRVKGSASVAITVPGKAAPYDPPPRDRCERRPVDLVICLDTSGSMTALIDSARGRLWDVVNELSRAKPMPRLRVGLLTYGTPGNSSAAAGWVVRQIDLTDDLDSVYAKMMAMRTSGGDEFVGWVLNDALQTMSWSHDPSALKIVFVAGNESADQAAEVFNFRSVAQQARSCGITINSIYAGNRRQGIAEQWDKVAQHGGGCYSAIDMQCGTVQIATPQDAVLIKLNAELNATYIPYGDAGAAGISRQRAQDRNAEEIGVQAYAGRAAAKGTALYTNSTWDLVDKAEEPGFDFAQVEDEALPADMRSMSVTARRARVESMKQKRADIQRQIQETNEARTRYLREEQKKLAGGKTSLDDAMLGALRQQATAAGFEFE